MAHSYKDSQCGSQSHSATVVQYLYIAVTAVATVRIGKHAEYI